MKSANIAFGGLVGLLDKFLSARPSRHKFSRMVMQALNKNGIADARYEEKDFSLQIGDGENVVFLENSYANFCKADKRQRQALLTQLGAAFATNSSIPTEYLQAPANLMPIIRDESYLSLVELQLRARNLGTSQIECPANKLADGLVVPLSYDTESSILQVNQSNFNRWEVGFDQALKASKDNLREKTDPSLFDEIAPGVYLGKWADSYDSARLLLTDLIYRLPLEGEPVAFVPNRNQLWVTGRLNRGGLKTMLEKGQPAHFAPYAVSPNLYVLRDGGWNAYVPEDSSVLDVWLDIKRRRETLDYNQQKESLDKVHLKANIDIFVANYLVFKRKDSSEYSACVWSKGVDSLLPETETIFFLTDPANNVS